MDLNDRFLCKTIDEWMEDFLQINVFRLNSYTLTDQVVKTHINRNPNVYV